MLHVDFCFSTSVWIPTCCLFQNRFCFFFNSSFLPSSDVMNISSLAGRAGLGLQQGRRFAGRLVIKRYLTTRTRESAAVQETQDLHVPDFLIFHCMSLVRSSRLDSKVKQDNRPVMFSCAEIINVYSRGATRKPALCICIAIRSRFFLLNAFQGNCSRSECVSTLKRYEENSLLPQETF